MLPHLGLFKKVACPFLPECTRSTCVFSHDIQLPQKRLPKSTTTKSDQDQTTTAKRQRSLSSTTTPHVVDNITNPIVQKKPSTIKKTNPSVPIKVHVLPHAKEIKKKKGKQLIFFHSSS